MTSTILNFKISILLSSVSENLSIWQWITANLLVRTLDQNKNSSSLSSSISSLIFRLESITRSDYYIDRFLSARWHFEQDSEQKNELFQIFLFFFCITISILLWIFTLCLSTRFFQSRKKNSSCKLNLEHDHLIIAFVVDWNSRNLSTKNYYWKFRHASCLICDEQVFQKKFLIKKCSCSFWLNFYSSHLRSEQEIRE